MRLGYALVGTNNLETAKQFYDALFATADIVRLHDGPRGALWGPQGGRHFFGIITPFDGERATHGNGMMVALALSDQASVKNVHAAALRLGATDEGTPGLRGDPAYEAFFAYFRDIDGNKIALYHVPA